MITIAMQRPIGGAERAGLYSGDRALADLLPIVAALGKAALSGSRSKGEAALRRLAEALARAERQDDGDRALLAHAQAEIEALLDARPVAGAIPTERASRVVAIDALARRGALTPRQVQAANALMLGWEATLRGGHVAAAGLDAKVDGAGAGAQVARAAMLDERARLAGIEDRWREAITDTQASIVHCVLMDGLTLTVTAARVGIRKQDVGVALRAALTCYADVAGFPLAVKGYD